MVASKRPTTRPIAASDPRTKQLRIHVTPDILDWLDQEKARTGEPLATQIRFILRAHIVRTEIDRRSA